MLAFLAALDGAFLDGVLAMVENELIVVVDEVDEIDFMRRGECFGLAELSKMTQVESNRAGFFMKMFGLER